MRNIASLLVAVAIAAVLDAQQARDQNRVAASGSASISGLVTEANGKTPIRRAQVTLLRSGLPDARSTSTDEQGRYTFTSLPAGQYLVSVNKGAYLRTSAGAVRPGLAGQQIVVRDGDAAVAPAVALWRGAVVAGRITDASGQPVRAAEVAAIQISIVGTERRPRRFFGGTTRTNDHGDYRIFGLPPGTYLLAASSSPQPLTELSAAEASWFLKPGPAAPPAPQRSFTYAPTLHPSTVEAQQAVLIPLEQGEHRPGLDVVLKRVPLARVSGRVLSPDGTPAAGVTISRMNDPTLPFVPNYGGQATSAADGSFALPDTAPGRYALTARGASAGAPPNVSPAEAQRMGLPAALRDRWARVPVAIDGMDITGLTIQLQPTVTITGRLAAQVAADRKVDLSRARIELLPPAIDAPSPFGYRASVNPDQTFTIEGVVPGSYMLRAILPGAPDLILRSAMAGARDAVDVPFDVPAGTGASGIVITFTEARTEVRGRITHASGDAATHLHVFAFPADRAQWLEGSRRFASMRTRGDGSYAIDTLPPGDYFLAALTELDPAMQYDADFLTELTKSSLRFTLGESEKKTQDLRIASAGGR